MKSSARLRRRSVGEATYPCPTCRQERRFDRQVVLRQPTFLAVPLGRATEVAHVLRCTTCAGVFEEDELVGPSVVDDVEHLATRLGVVAVLQAGDPTDTTARTAAVLAVRDTTTLAYDLEALELDLTMAPADRLGTYLRPAASFPSVARERILARLVTVALAGGPHDGQRHLLAVAAHHLELDVEVCRAIVERCRAEAAPRTDLPAPVPAPGGPAIAALPPPPPPAPAADEPVPGPPSWFTPRDAVALPAVIELADPAPVPADAVAAVLASLPADPVDPVDAADPEPGPPDATEPFPEPAAAPPSDPTADPSPWSPPPPAERRERPW